MTTKTKADVPVLEWFDVKRVQYRKFVPEGKRPLMKVTYFCNGERGQFSEIVCLEDSRFRKLAEKWWIARMGSEQAPPNVDEALKWTSLLAVPEAIQVWTNRKYPEVVGHRGFTKGAA